MSRELGYQEGGVNALWMLGAVHEMEQGARAYYEESLDLAKRLRYTWGAMHCLTYFGRFEMLHGNYASAIRLLHDCEAEARALGGDLDQLADCRAYLGEIAGT